MKKRANHGRLAGETGIFRTRGLQLLMPVIFMAILLLASTASAQFDRLTIQGQLRDDSNTIVTGDYNFSFSIYTQLTGGTPIFQQNFTDLEVDANGMYTVTLTDVDIPFDQDYYLGVAINGEVEMTPRANITDMGTAFRSNVSEHLGSYDSSYFLNTSSEMQTIGGNMTVVNTLFVGTGGYSGGGITASGAGNLYIGGNLYISGDMIPVHDLSINGSNVPKLDNLFTLGNSTSRWQTAYIGTGGIYSSGGISSFSGSDYANLTPSGELLLSGNATASSFIVSSGISLGGDYRTSWPTGTGNTTEEIWSIVDNGTFLKIAGGTMTGNLAVNADLNVDSGDLFVDSSEGRVGIGTAAPQTTLNARNPSSSAFLRLEGFSDGADYAGIDLWNLTENRAWRMSHSSSGSFAVQYYDGGWDSPLIILNDGNVSIGGSSSPSYKLEVGGSANITGNIYVGSGGVCIDSSGSCGTPGAGNLSAANIIATTGISIGGDYRTSWPASSGNSSSEMWAVVDNGTFLKIAGGTMTGSLVVNANLNVDSGDLFVDSGTGKVGIGTASPQHTLTVAGNVNVTEDNDRIYYGSGGEQYYNGTCMIIKGGSNTLEIC